MYQLKYMLIQTAILACSFSALGEDFELNAWQSEGMVYSKFTWTVHLKGTELRIERPGKMTKVKRIKPGDIETLRSTLDQSGFASLGAITATQALMMLVSAALNCLPDL